MIGQPLLVLGLCLHIKLAKFFHQRTAETVFSLEYYYDALGSFCVSRLKRTCPWPIYETLGGIWPFLGRVNGA
jgi:hypothetical protein